MNLLFLGDFFYDYDYIAEDIEKIAEWIKKENAYTILNLEGGIDNSGKKIAKRGPNLCSSPITMDVLKKLNVIGVCLANNHIMDFGEGSLEKTINALDKNDILYVGAGKNLQESLKPMMIDNDTAIINFAWDVEEAVNAKGNKPGCAPRDERIILNKISELKKDGKRVIVCIHWGFEYNRFPMPYDIDLAHKMIDAGCEMIIGSHPHCVQAKETYNGKKIYYSLGNFYFASRRKKYNKEFNEEVKNQSDYGIGVLYNFQEVKECIIEANRDSESSSIYYLNTDKILKDISNENYLSKQYLKKVKATKKNINPILTLNPTFNSIKLKKLYSYYKIKSIAKKILKRR